MYQSLADLVDQLIAPQSDSEGESMEATSAAGMCIFFIEVAIVSRNFEKKNDY